MEDVLKPHRSKCIIQLLCPQIWRPFMHSACLQISDKSGGAVSQQVLFMLVMKPFRFLFPKILIELASICFCKWVCILVKLLDVYTSKLYWVCMLVPVSALHSTAAMGSWSAKLPPFTDIKRQLTFMKWYYQKWSLNKQFYFRIDCKREVKCRASQWHMYL